MKRAAISGLLVAALAGCKGSTQHGGAGVQPSNLLEVACGTYNAGLTGRLVVAAVFDPPLVLDVVLEVADDTSHKRLGSVTCRAGTRTCIEAVAGSPAWLVGGGDLHTVVSVAYDAGAGPEVLLCLPFAFGRLPQPEGIAAVVDGKLEVTWSSVPGAQVYSATFRDLDLRPPDVRNPRKLVGPVVTPETRASFELPDGKLPDLAVVDLEAWAADPETFTLGVEPSGQARRSVTAIPVIGAPWALWQPGEFADDGTLILPVPEGSRLAVIPMNLQGVDGAVVHLQAAGTGPALARRVAPSRGAGPDRLVAAPPRVTDLVAVSTTFCTYVNPPCCGAGCSGTVATRRPATLARETPTSLVYVDDADAGGFTTSDWDDIAAWWERAYASVTAYSGPPSDVDGNGRFILFFTSALGPRSWSIFSVEDVKSDLDGTLACNGKAIDGKTSLHASNHADMIHLHPPFGMEDPTGRPLTRDEAWAVVRSRMANALQRMVDPARFTRCWDYECEDAILHARGALAETVAGSGDHEALLRQMLAPLWLTRAGEGLGGYPVLPLFPYAPYAYVGDGTNAAPEPPSRAAIASFIRYLADRLGPGFTAQFFDTVTDVRELEVVSGIPFPMAYALWTGALLFSNEPASPWQGFHYLGPPFVKPDGERSWIPLHQKFMPFEYAPLQARGPVTATLRQNGFDVYVTGVAGPGGGTVTVTSGETVKPYVVAIPFQGELP